MDEGAWQATVHGVAKSQTRLSDFLSFYTYTDVCVCVCVCIYRQSNFYFFWLCHEACRTLVPQSGIKPTPTVVKVWGPSHFTIREFPSISNF